LTVNRRYVIHQLRGHLHKDAGVRVFPDNLSQAWSLDAGLSEGKE